MMPERTRWALVLLIWVAGLAAAAQYGKISVIFDRIGAFYPQAGAWLGFTVSMVGVLGILLGAVAGAFVAAMGYRRMLLAALWIGAAMSALQALGLPFALFLATRGIEGLSHLGLVVAAPTLIAQISAERDRGATLTLWSTFFSVAFALLAWLGIPLVERFGVTALFAAHAALMALLAVLLRPALARVPAPVRQPMPRLRDLPAVHREIYRSPHIGAPAAGWLFYTCCFLAALTLLPAHVDPGLRALVAGAMPLVSIVVSLTFGVWLLRHMPAVTVVEIGFGLGTLAAAWLWLSPGGPAASLGLAAALGLVQGATFAAVPQLNATAATRAQANGALAQAGNLGNTLGTPLLLAATSVAGYAGMIALMALLLLAGLAVHRGLAGLRRVV
ncbi:Predicted arabinose efflux permease, MFS family [Cribrihabitans marinus]|uniref:Predicted arabinose efflux permease, MFS family n=1 Tax=Cribrihabitans marinus TaxID=1227549 RepID=A0A1H6VTB1_9RHOB|nr:MFS transporter [Cribrihabitans marinus]GGH25843.1 MFS transporter [Cribrihabitans marinus]SEJ03265.1 Predicted arabinose efflux permease, MFS family [Cribrihabitans marinus]